MTEDELRKGLEGVMSKAGWTEDDIIDFVRDNLKSLVEIDKPLIGFVIKGHLKTEPVAARNFLRDSLVRDISRANPIKLKEE